jgi:hypothetical protein
MRVNARSIYWFDGPTHKVSQSDADDIVMLRRKRCGVAVRQREHRQLRRCEYRPTSTIRRRKLIRVLLETPVDLNLAVAIIESDPHLDRILRDANPDAISASLPERIVNLGIDRLLCLMDAPDRNLTNAMKGAKR